jgi:hypothetical protein
METVVAADGRAPCPSCQTRGKFSLQELAEGEEPMAREEDGEGAIEDVGMQEELNEKKDNHFDLSTMSAGQKIHFAKPNKMDNGAAFSPEDYYFGLGRVSAENYYLSSMSVVKRILSEKLTKVEQEDREEAFSSENYYFMKGKMEAELSKKETKPTWKQKGREAPPPAEVQPVRLEEKA